MSPISVTQDLAPGRLSFDLSEIDLKRARAVAALGYAADPQVGRAGFRIDLGIRDPRPRKPPRRRCATGRRP